MAEEARAVMAEAGVVGILADMVEATVKVDTAVVAGIAVEAEAEAEAMAIVVAVIVVAVVMATAVEEVLAIVVGDEVAVGAEDVGDEAGATNHIVTVNHRTPM
jgi:hypothetical protein